MGQQAQHCRCLWVLAQALPRRHNFGSCDRDQSRSSDLYPSQAPLRANGSCDAMLLTVRIPQGPLGQGRSQARSCRARRASVRCLAAQAPEFTGRQFTL